MPPKSIFRQPGAKHFQLVHRSQRDPLLYDENASQHVLKPFERENVKKGKSRADLESSLSLDDLVDSKDGLGEAALYGITYDDSEYDYMQHLRPVGVEEEGVESVLIEAPQTSRKPLKAANKQATPIQLRDLPAEALPSTSELSRDEAYESQQNIPSSIAGFQPDMDPHLRQVLEALEDDAFVDDGLEDDFFGELVADGQREDEDEVDFDFREEGIPDDTDENLSRPEKDPDSWEARFAQFKQASRTSPVSHSGSESGDTIGKLPTPSVAGTRYKRRRGGSEVSGFSMSSVRTEAQQTLDDRFEQMILREYGDDDEEIEQSDDGEESDEAPDLIASREDFEQMVNSFLNDYEIVGRRMKRTLPGEDGAEKLDTIRRALGTDERVRVADGNDEDEADDILVPLDIDNKKDRWDCETVLTTYSNLENHPRLIRASQGKMTPRIHLDRKTGLPTVTHMGPTPLEHSDDEDSTEDEGQVRITVTRPRNETKDEKKARKQSVKEERRNRRTEKRNLKEQFSNEYKMQIKMISNKEKPRMKKL